MPWGWWWEGECLRGWWWEGECLRDGGGKMSALGMVVGR